MTPRLGKANLWHFLPFLIMGALSGYIASTLEWRTASLLILTITSAITLIALRPTWLLYLFMVSIFILEEYPSVTVESARWIRTPFYSRSMGLPGLYAYDLFFVLALLFFFIYLLSRRRQTDMPINLAPSLFFFFSSILISIAISIISRVISPPILNYDVSTIGFEFHGAAIYLIGFAQTKTFLYFFFTAVTFFILLFTRSKLYMMLGVVGASIVFSLLIGLYRLYMHPVLNIEQGVPLFYDSASNVAFFLLIISVLVVHLLKIKISATLKIVLTAISLLSILMIAFSFRRTVWLCSFMVIAWLCFRLGPKDALLRNLSGLVAIGAAFLLVTELTGVDVIPMGITQRVKETTLGESSTLYRFMIYRNAVDVIKDAPLFGHGLTPLWNYQIRHGRFLQTYENVHSLYLWMLFRWGIVGFSGFIWILFHFFSQVRRILRHTSTPVQDRAIALIATYGMLGYLVTAAFFPVYGMVRFMVMMGLLVAIVERLAFFNSQPEGV